jgi:hypothetical protein
MTCQDFELQIALLTEGDLNASEAERVELHLARCPQCRRFAEEIAESQTALKTYGPLEPHPNELVALRLAVMTRIPIQEKSRRVGFFSWRLAWRFAAAVALLAGGTLVWRALDRSAPPDPVSNVRLAAPPNHSAIIRTETQPNSTATTARNDAARPRPAALNFATVRHARRAAAHRRAASLPSEPPSAAMQENVRIEIQTSDPNVRIIWISSAHNAPSAPSRKI